MSTKTSTVRKESKFTKYLKGPIKVLARARDFYLQNVTGCAGQVAYYGSSMACPAPHPETLPRSFSESSAHDSSTNHSYGGEDVMELVRIASARGIAGKSEAELLRSRKSQAAVTRSRTVAIGRIDEDRPCEFGGKGENDVVAEGAGVYYPRSKSYAASGRSRKGVKI